MVNTKNQSNACMCEMMSKGSKEALIVLIVTHVNHVKGVERHSKYTVKAQNIFAHNFLNI